MAGKGEQKKDFKAYTGMLKHVNEQTFAAAVVDMAEAIPNPAYREGENTGMLIHAVKIIPEPAKLNHAAVGNDSYYLCQLQIGARAATPTILMPDSPWLAGHFEAHQSFQTSGKFISYAPFYLDLLMPDTVIVHDQFTILHDATNNAAFQNEPFYTVIYYQLVNCSAGFYTRLLMDQTRQS